MNLQNDLMVKGRWWIPDKDGKSYEKVIGELYYKKYDGIKLVLESSFFDTKSIFRENHNIIIPLIFGVSNDNLHITLINNVVNEFGSNHRIQAEIDSEYLLLNEEGYFAKIEERIHTLNFSTNFFHSFFRGHHDHIQSNLKDEKFCFDLEDKSVEVVDNEKITAYFYYSKGFKGLGEEEITIWQKPFFNVQFKTNISILDSIQKINYYRDFFSFISSPIISYESIHVFTKDEQNKDIEFSLIFKQRAYQIGHKIRPHEVLLFYKEMKHNIDKLFVKWIDNEELNQNILALYMQSTYLKFPSEIQIFLNIVFAIETLHNTFFDQKIFSPEALQKFKNEKKRALAEIFSEEFKSKLNECLAHFSTLSFSQRLKDLIKRNLDFTKPYLTGIDVFVKKVTKQRNFLAHNHGQRDRAEIDTSEYYYYIAILKIVFVGSFLSQAGFEQKQIDIIIKRNFSYLNNQKLLH